MFMLLSHSFHSSGPKYNVRALNTTGFLQKDKEYCEVLQAKMNPKVNACMNLYARSPAAASCSRDEGTREQFPFKSLQKTRGNHQIP